MDWTEAAQQGEVIMRGTLADQSAANVLLALSLSRQFTSVELLTGPEEIEGRVFLKAGHVLAVETRKPDIMGIPAFRHLLNLPLVGYVVYRLPAPDRFPPPLGKLSTQLVVHATLQDDLDSSLDITAAAPSMTASVASLSAVGAPPNAARGVAAPAARSLTPAHVEPPAAPLRAPAASAVAPLRSVTPSVATPQVREGLRPAATAAVPLAAPVAAAPVVAAKATAVPVIAVVSPKGGSGKTTVALNLSIALARTGVRVVLVDADPNGDILSALGAHQRAVVGIYDALCSAGQTATPTMRTALPCLQVVAALGRNTPLANLNRVPEPQRWAAALGGYSAGTDVIIVDTPAGMLGATTAVLSVVSGVVGVLQAETIPHRSFSMFGRGLSALPRAPKVLGVVLNMVNRDDPASMAVVQAARSELGATLLNTEVARDAAFHTAATNGVPAAMPGAGGHADLAAVFDGLADEIRSRAGLAPAKAGLGSFLL